MVGLVSFWSRDVDSAKQHHPAFPSTGRTALPLLPHVGGFQLPALNRLASSLVKRVWVAGEMS